jgi:uncharacterized protein
MTGPASDRVAASPREVVERLHRLVVDRHLSGQADLYAADGVLEWPFAPPGVPQRVQGREEIRRVLSALERGVRQADTRVAPFPRSVVVHETRDPEVVIVELEVEGETPTGETFRLPYIQVFRVRDGEILTFRDYFGAGTAQALTAALVAAG